MDGSAHLEFPEKLGLLPLSPILLRGQWFPPSHRKPPPFLRLPPHLPICWRSPESIRYSSESPGLSRLKRRLSDGSCPVTLCWSHLPSVHPSCRTQTFVINTQERVSLHASISTMDRWRFYMWNRTPICEIKPPFVLKVTSVTVVMAEAVFFLFFFPLRFSFVPKKNCKNRRYNSHNASFNAEWPSSGTKAHSGYKKPSDENTFERVKLICMFMLHPFQQHSTDIVRHCETYPNHTQIKQWLRYYNAILNFPN